MILNLNLVKTGLLLSLTLEKKMDISNQGIAETCTISAF